MRPPDALNSPANATVVTSAGITSASPLPPFRSTTKFPRNPTQEQLPSLYATCFEALQEANVARVILKARMDGKKQMIGAIRLEIERLGQDLALEANTRASLHSLNQRLIHALREMEGLAGELDDVVGESHGTARTRLGRLIEKLKEWVRRWRAFKHNEHKAMADGVSDAQDGVRDA